MNYLAKYLYVINARKIELLFIVVAFLVVSVLDAVGIGLVGPFIGLAANPELIQKNAWLAQAYSSVGIQSLNQFIGFLGLVIVAVFFIKSFLYYQVQKYVFRFCFTNQVKLRLRLLKTYLLLPYKFHLQTNSAHLIQSIIKESEHFTYAVSIPLFTLVANVFVLVVLVLLLAKTDIVATVSITGILLAAFVPFHYFRNKLSKWGKEGVDANTEMLRITNHALGGLKETRVIGCEGYFVDQLETQVDKFARVATFYHIFQALPRISIETLLITFVVGFVSFSLLFDRRSDSLISVLGVFAIASVRLLPSASQLLSNMGTLRNFQPTLEKIFYELKEIETPESREHIKLSRGILPDPSKVVDVQNLIHADAAPLTFADKVVLNQLNYRYSETSENALSGISLTLHKGESIALIGKSGSGKTTLVDLFLGLLIPHSGDIQVDGQSVYGNLRSWQNLIGYIPQSIFLIDDTIARNIAFGVPDELIDPRKLKQSIQSAQLYDMVAELPDGIETMVGEHGVRLSGGQRQRIGIARALYHEREILVLDEATSALDNETETLVSQAIQELSQSKTMIIIAHRLTTVKHCDRVYELDKGTILRSGSYDEIVPT
jgi:ATP-binding cassette, subfamily B, bacterial PglK